MLLTHLTQLTQWLIFMNEKINYEDIPLHKMSRQERLDKYASEYKTINNELEKNKGKLEYLREQILAEYPEDYGEIEIPFEDEGRLKITAPLKYSWDKSTLSEMFSSGGLPECVSTNFTVSKRLYDAADVEVKQKLSKALTIKCGTPTVKVMKT